VSRRLIILGATGSIGVQALDVVSRASADELRVVALSAESSWERLIAQAQAHGVRRIALTDPTRQLAPPRRGRGEVFSGPAGLMRLIARRLRTRAERDRRLGGPRPSVATLTEGIELALANKESLVVGGELVMQLAEGTGATIIPSTPSTLRFTN